MGISALQLRHFPEPITKPVKGQGADIWLCGPVASVATPLCPEVVLMAWSGCGCANKTLFTKAGGSHVWPVGLLPMPALHEYFYFLINIQGPLMAGQRHRSTEGLPTLWLHGRNVTSETLQAFVRVLPVPGHLHPLQAHLGAKNSFRDWNKPENVLKVSAVHVGCLVS